MQTHDPANPPAAPKPRRTFASPEALAEAAELDIETRRTLLVEWETDLDSRLKAEEEGMSASDPISQRKEGSLADEIQRVRTALLSLGELPRMGPNSGGP